MISLNNQTKTVICIGAGGVGKTTFSAALAVGQAMQGKKVLVLTIDPSLRLAQALNFKSDGDVYDISTAVMKKKSGRLCAVVLNPEKAFEEFLLQASQKKISKEDLARLQKNKLYRQLSTRLSGSQEFTSLFKLQQYVSSLEYDLVILDTPPAQHVRQFLQAPEKLSKLFHESVASWFRQSADRPSLLKKALNFGTTQILKALEVMTGAEFVQELSLFFQAIQNWQAPLEEQILKCQKLLVSPTTEFFLVTALDPSRLHETQKIFNDIRLEGYHLTTLVINKVPPEPVKKNNLSAKMKFYVQHQQLLQKQMRAVVEDVSSAGFKKNLCVYKSEEVSQNDLHAQGLYKIYQNFQQV